MPNPPPVQRMICMVAASEIRWVRSPPHLSRRLVFLYSSAVGVSVSGPTEKRVEGKQCYVPVLVRVLLVEHGLHDRPEGFLRREWTRRMYTSVEGSKQQLLLWLACKLLANIIKITKSGSGSGIEKS